MERPLSASVHTGPRRPCQESCFTFTPSPPAAAGVSPDKSADNRHSRWPLFRRGKVFKMNLPGECGEFISHYACRWCTRGPLQKNGSGGMPNSVIRVSRRACRLYKEAQTIRFVSYACQSVTVVKGQQSGGTVPRRGNKHTNTTRGATPRTLSLDSVKKLVCTRAKPPTDQRELQPNRHEWCLKSLQRPEKDMCPLHYNMMG